MAQWVRRACMGVLAAVAACDSDVTSGNGGIVQPPPQASSQVASVTVAPELAVLFVGDTLRLWAVTREAAGSVLSGRVVTWVSAAPGVASVSTSGLVTATTVGSAIVTATSEGRSGQVSLSIVR